MIPSIGMIAALKSAWSKDSVNYLNFLCPSFFAFFAFFCGYSVSSLIFAPWREIFPSWREALSQV
jgi:hypothetical protein